MYIWPRTRDALITQGLKIHKILRKFPLPLLSPPKKTKDMERSIRTINFPRKRGNRVRKSRIIIFHREVGPNLVHETSSRMFHRSGISISLVETSRKGVVTSGSLARSSPVEGVARLKQRSLVKITIAHVVVGVIKELTGAIRRSCSEAKRRVSF